jgi:hypothetical protein
MIRPEIHKIPNVLAGVYGRGSPMAKRLRKLREQMANTALRGKRGQTCTMFGKQEHIPDCLP